jgi:small-conductance mechanosensitive channel
VLFEDFGDNAQMLALHFWVELAPRVSAVLVASDLRFMIEKSFAESGIVIAYPQRDVHLHAEAPLRVELAAKSEGRTGAIAPAEAADSTAPPAPTADATGPSPGDRDPRA